MSRLLRIFSVACLAAAFAAVPAARAFGETPASAADAVPATAPVPALDVSDAAKFSSALAPLWERPTRDLLDALKPALARPWETTKAVSDDKTTSRTALCRAFFGVPAEYVKVEELHERPVRIEIMFFNKGDAPSRANIGRETEMTAEEKTDFVEDAWTKSLREVARAAEPLGKMRQCSLGAGKARRRARTLTHDGNAFFFDAKENEYVRVFVVPEANSREMKTTVVKDRAKGSFKKNVERRANGDMLVGNVPMVNQGDKGYCVPATVERVLRYFGVEDIDMHQIADAAGTRAGGGTSVQALVRGLNEIVRQRKLKFVSEEMSLREIRKNVNDGLPMIWCMDSTDAYRKRLEETTRERAAEKNFSAWAKRVKAMEPLDLEGVPRGKHAHVCLIIGCNPKTKEICVSDSWGDYAQERWIRFDDAALATLSEELVVLKK